MKKIIITGCSGSIGSYLANHYKKKFKVIGLDKFPSNIKGIEFYKVNLLKKSDLNKIYRRIFQKHKKVNILVNAAGYIHNELFLNFSNTFKTHEYKNWKKVFNNNVDITFLNTKVYVDYFSKNFRDEKIIINFSSINSDGVVGQIAYSSAKSAIETMTKVLSKELSKFNFRIACISPGYFKVKSTLDNINKKNLEKVIDSIPLKKLGNARDIALGIDFIIKNKYFNGKVLKIDGGK